MLKKKISNKYIVIGIIVLLIPIILPVLNTIIDILVNLGRVLGTITRQAELGIFCKSL